MFRPYHLGYNISINKLDNLKEELIMIYLAMIVLLMGAEIFGTMLLGTSFLIGGIIGAMIEVLGKKGAIALGIFLVIFFIIIILSDQIAYIEIYGW